MPKHAFTTENLEEQEMRALTCSSGTIPGPQLRELIRLAKIGHAHERAQAAGNIVSDEDDDRQVVITDSGGA